MLFVLVDIFEILFNVFDFLAFKKRYKKKDAEENLVWVKKQDWYENYTNDPKWKNMLEKDKKMNKILGSYRYQKLFNREELQESLKKELIDYFEDWKITWKLQ